MNCLECELQILIKLMHATCIKIRSIFEWMNSDCASSHPRYHCGDGNSLAEFRIAYKLEEHRISESVSAPRCRLQSSECENFYKVEHLKSKWINSWPFSWFSVLFRWVLRVGIAHLSSHLSPRTHHFSSQVVRCQDDTLDCDQAPPSNVDPTTCCRISKPFDRLNFPDCFGDVDQTSTARNDIFNRDDDRDVRNTGDGNIRNRNNLDQRNSNSNNNDRRNERIPSEDRDSDQSEEDQRDNRRNSKPHWGFTNGHRHGGGWWHHAGYGGHGDYRSFGSGGRYRHKRQLDRVVVRTSVRALVTLGSGVGNGNVMTKWKFPLNVQKFLFFFWTWP